MREPNWKTDYPVSRVEEHRVSRRQFVSILGGGVCACAAAAPAIDKIIETSQPMSKTTKSVATVDELAPGEYKLFTFPTEHDPAILVRLKGGSYKAYSQRCTHLLCPVHFKPETESLYCPCHHGSFDAENGAVQFGPPRLPLPQFQVEERNGQIWVSPFSNRNSVAASDPPGNELPHP